MTASLTAPPSGADDRPRAVTRSWASRWPVPLWFVARYGATVLAGAVMLATELTAMAQRGMQWRGDLVWTIDWLPVSFVLVAPVVAGLSALDTARMATGAGHLAHGPFFRTPAFAVVATYSVLAVLTHCLVLAVALVVSAPQTWDPAAPLAVLVQLLMLVVFAALGGAAGRFARPKVAGSVGALSAFALMYVAGGPDQGLALFEFGGATVPRVGFAYDAGHLAWQAVALAAVAAALVVLRPVEGPRGRRPDPRDAAFSVVLLTLVAALVSTVDSDRLRVVGAAPTVCGEVEGVTTCFYAQHRRIEKDFQQALFVLASSARDQGYDALVPTEVDEAAPGSLPQDQDPEVAAFYVMPDHLQGASPTLWDVASGIVQPVHCPQVQGDDPPSDRYWKDLDALVGTWVGLADPSEVAMRAPDARTLGPAEAATIAEGFRTCTYPNF